MDYRIKMLCEKILEFTPSGIKIHSLFETRRPGIDLEKKLFEKLYHLNYLLKHSNFNFNNSKILELGTGWDGCDVLLFYLLGAREIHTVDHIDHLTHNRMLEMLAILEKNLFEISKRLDEPLNKLEKRMSLIEKNTTLHSLLGSCNIHYYAPQKIAELNFETESFDLFYSYSVMQRLKIEELQSVLRMVYELLRENGLSYHWIRHNDLNITHDPNLNPFYYLKYDDWFWELIQSPKFNYQNRLRHEEMLNILKKAGFKHIREEIYRWDSNLIRQLDLADKYKKFSLEELAIGSTVIMSSKNYKGNLITDVQFNQRKYSDYKAEEP